MLYLWQVCIFYVERSPRVTLSEMSTFVFALLGAILVREIVAVYAIERVDIRFHGDRHINLEFLSRQQAGQSNRQNRTGIRKGGAFEYKTDANNVPIGNFNSTRIIMGVMQCPCSPNSLPAMDIAISIMNRTLKDANFLLHQIYTGNQSASLHAREDFEACEKKSSLQDW